MKMVKSLLLGSAAGLVAVAGAQAADLPVKAKPVQYVKICSLYGVGFYYIPGTDMCLKIGGWVRAEYGWGLNGNLAPGVPGATATSTTAPPTTATCVPAATSRPMPATRPNTARCAATSPSALADNEHGGDVPATSFNANRAFIQWAGFTFGQAQSFFDFYSVPGDVILGCIPGVRHRRRGWKVLAYTAQFGNGFSATIAAEMPRADADLTATALGTSTLRRQRLARCSGARLRWLPRPRHRRQPARRPGLGFCPDHGRRASGQ